MDNKKVLTIMVVVTVIIIALAVGLGYILITNTTTSEISNAVFDATADYPQVSNLSELVVKDVVAKLKEDNGKLYIPVKKDGKYTYIDESGNKAINDEFDIATEFANFKLTDDKVYSLACVYKNGRKFVIQQDNSTLFEMKSPKELTGLDEEIKYNEVATTLEDFITGTISGSITNFSVLDISKNQTLISSISTSCKQIKKVNGKFDYNDKYYIEQEELNTDSFEAYPINPRMYDTFDKYQKAKDKKIINYNYYLTSKTDENDKIKLDCDDLFIKNDILYIYNNGNIPFVSVLKNESGWFDQDGKKTTLPSSTMRVVELKDNAIIVIENYNQTSSYTLNGVSEEEFDQMKTSTSEDNTTTAAKKDMNTVYALGLAGDPKTSSDYKILYMTDKGYILKNLKTNKYYVADKDFKLLFEDGFDIITPYLLDKGYIIAGKKVQQVDTSNVDKAVTNTISDEEETQVSDLAEAYTYKIYDFSGNEISSDEYDNVYATVSNTSFTTSFENLIASNTAVMQLNDNILNKLIYKQLYIDKQE